MKSRIRLASAVLLLILLLSGCGKKTKVETELSVTSLALSVGDSATVEIVGDYDGDVAWECEDANVARVFYGAVTALGEGETAVHATIGEKKLTCHVTVTGDSAESNNSVLNEKTENSTTGDSTRPTASIDDTSNEADNASKTNAAVKELIKKAYENQRAKVNNEYDKIISDYKKKCEEDFADYNGRINEYKLRLADHDNTQADIDALNKSIKILEDGLAEAKKVRDGKIAEYNDERQKRLTEIDKSEESDLKLR